MSHFTGNQRDMGRVCTRVSKWAQAAPTTDPWKSLIFQLPVRDVASNEQTPGAIRSSWRKPQQRDDTCSHAHLAPAPPPPPRADGWHVHLKNGGKPKIHFLGGVGWSEVGSRWWRGSYIFLLFFFNQVPGCIVRLSSLLCPCDLNYMPWALCTVAHLNQNTSSFHYGLGIWSLCPCS